MTPQLRPLTTIDELREVWRLEHEVWGYTTSDDAVPVPILIVTAKIGGLLLGAFEPGDRMVGFAYSLPGIADGRPYQWSHMLGVVPACRNRGVGRQLKLEQRRRTLAMGLDLVQWTYDPLQAANAHLNLARLGVIVRRYEENVYGDSSSPLHRGTPTDRFIAEWWLRSARVEARLRGEAPGDAAARAVNAAVPEGPWLAPAGHDLAMDESRLAVVIPVGFTEMQVQQPALAVRWRSATREIFASYLARGYEVVNFAFDADSARGRYLLERHRER